MKIRTEKVIEFSNIELMEALAKQFNIKKKSIVNYYIANFLKDGKAHFLAYTVTSEKKLNIKSAYELGVDSKRRGSTLDNCNAMILSNPKLCAAWQKGRDSVDSKVVKSKGGRE